MRLSEAKQLYYLTIDIHIKHMDGVAVWDYSLDLSVSVSTQSCVCVLGAFLRA